MTKASNPKGMEFIVFIDYLNQSVCEDSRSQRVEHQNPSRMIPALLASQRLDISVFADMIFG